MFEKQIKKGRKKHFREVKVDTRDVEQITMSEMFESSHAVAYAVKLAKELDKDDVLIVNLSGRGDKDVEQVFQMLNK